MSKPQSEDVNASKIKEFSKKIASRLVANETAPQTFFDETILVNQTISDTIKIRDSILDAVKERKDGESK